MRVQGINVPRFADLEEHRTDLEGGWATMLAHQLPTLPPLEAFWNELPAFFVWMEGGAAPVVPAAYAIATGETVLRDRTMRLPLSGGAGSYQTGLCALVLRIVRRIQRIALPLAALITAVQRVERTDLCLRVLLLREALQQEEADLAA